MQITIITELRLEEWKLFEAAIVKMICDSTHLGTVVDLLPMILLAL